MHEVKVIYCDNENHSHIMTDPSTWYNIPFFHCRPLSREYQELGKSIFLTSAGTDTGMGRKKTHGELQEKISGLWTNCRLFEKGIKFFSGRWQTNYPQLYKKQNFDVMYNSIRHIAIMNCPFRFAFSQLPMWATFAIKAQIQLYMKFVCKFFLDFPIPTSQANPNR